MCSIRLERVNFRTETFGNTSVNLGHYLDMGNVKLFILGVSSNTLGVQMIQNM